ncbi:PaaX domain-containing protein, C- domain protein [Rhodococcus sp. D2-41]|uniref:PaaX domain-containing protein, C- domain protein n=1 Tax=Speluncibacter jeojiensis TaxID=2710754 RepID=A0A9X4M1R5_9ACTN|nr:PaaX family transcriptional regulator C-terminal domain-containing protein [Rhodococcus sp. D2-41]MDG3009481.1 PaaX domain-containing protein, C- domain protein [Rhodococcus sp. D2-41]MDG3016410.1 PaaX domain-containing protein, C- domain protein [Corynebacteriales bacterium D3-21]
MILSAFLGAPAEARASAIIAMAEVLGLQESAVRVALTRMVSSGDLERDNGLYRLAPRLRERQVRQDEARHPPMVSWNGQWTVAVVGDGGDADRVEVGESLQQMRFRPLREGVWMRPNNIDVALPAGVVRCCSVFTAVPVDSSRELAQSLFQPDGWAQTAHALLAESPDTPSARFELAAAMIRHLMDDPLLPSELTPTDWPGPRLRGAYEEFRAEFIDLARTHLGHGGVR